MNGDRAQRDRALDPTTSFIVQAPAGSGKTELLIQRILALLATVDAPEEVLAITFTRKAAGEMRNRLLQALRDADGETPPAAPHRALTWRLARAVLERDARQGWCLIECPSRLQVMTIDGFNALLVRQLPMISGAGGPVTIADDPQPMYVEAARRTLAAAGAETVTGRVAASLLRHLDNDFGLAERHLCNLLARRDHWLPRILAAAGLPEGDRRVRLEASLRRDIERVQARLRDAFPAALIDEWISLAGYAADRLGEAKPHHPVVACRGLESLPPADASELAVWQGLADLLLVRAGGWRQRLDKNCGFPPDDRESKSRMSDLLDALRDDEDLRLVLDDVRSLPLPRFSSGQWDILGGLLALLPVCAGELTLEFRGTGQVDYVALASSARAALGTEDAPTDLALALDYRLRHILVDEYQDVSASQVELLTRLTAGWTQGDGRTLFCVGDPMQSIYRFREAEVAQFLYAREQGIGPVRLEPLTLEMNFRSGRHLVDWYNRMFARMFRDRDEPHLGAVAYAPATASATADEEGSVTLTAVPAGESVMEAAMVADRIEAIRAGQPSASVAVLVRAKSHFAEIAPALRARGLRFQAVEIESLKSRQPVQDLLALTRALCHLGDRTAWLAVLRAPWCGLRLSELLVIASDDDRTIWEALLDDAVLAGLPEDARARAGNLRTVLAAALSDKGRRPLHRLVAGAWLALGGPATVPEPANLVDARQYFELLRELEVAGDVEDVTTLESHLNELYAAADVEAGPSLQLMTIHKAKGLEFDHVILPGLDRQIRATDRPLLHWQEIPRADGHADLLLAPMEPRGADPDPLQAHIRRLEKRRDDHELQRLLYVASTRARKTLHLVTRLPPQDDNGEHRKPYTGTLLALLWPGLKDGFLAGCGEPPARAAGVERGVEPCIERLVAGWSVPAPPADVAAVPGTGETDANAPLALEFDWAGEVIRAVGTVVHRLLECIAGESIDHWTPDRVTREQCRFAVMLTEAGVPAGRLPGAVSVVADALTGVLEDERGRWIMSPGRVDAHSEYAVAGMLDGRPAGGVVDRCFLDEDGVRWIVDFKISPHAGGDIERFLEIQKTRYREQLERYARLLAALYPDESRRRVGLYFPLQRRFEAWTPDCDRPAGEG